MIDKIKTHKKTLVTSLSTWLALCFNTGLAFAEEEKKTNALGDAVAPVQNTVVNEANGLILPIVIIGIIIIGTLVMLGKRTMAIVATISLIVGIILIKNASTIGAMINSGV